MRCFAVYRRKAFKSARCGGNEIFYFQGIIFEYLPAGSEFTGTGGNPLNPPAAAVVKVTIYQPIKTWTRKQYNAAPEIFRRKNSGTGGNPLNPPAAAVVKGTIYQPIKNLHLQTIQCGNPPENAANNSKSVP